MTKTSKVKAVTLGNEWTSKHGGTFYNHTYQLEDGTTLQASHKTQMPFKEGDEVEYEITSTDEQYGNKGKIKKPDSGGGFSRGGGGYKPDTLGIAIGQGMNLAVEMYCADKIQKEQIEATVKWFAELSYKLRGELSELDNK